MQLEALDTAFKEKSGLEFVINRYIHVKDIWKKKIF